MWAVLHTCPNCGEVLQITMKERGLSSSLRLAWRIKPLEERTDAR